MDQKKTSLLLIPEVDDMICRSEYLSMCIDHNMAEGYIPLTPGLYSSTSVSQEEFVNCTLPYVDAVFMYINYGIDKVMFQVIDKVFEVKDLHYRRIAEAEIKKLNSSPAAVLADLCSRTATTPEMLRSKSRKRELVDLRFVYYRRAKEITTASLAAIGREVNRDHATVLHGVEEAHDVRAVQELYDRCYKHPAPQNNKPAEVIHPVLPYRLADPREKTVPSGKQLISHISGRGFGAPYNGYTPHNE